MRIALVAVAAALLAAPAATAKDFRPGDLRLCNLSRCVPVESPAVLRALSGFYYSGGSPRPASSPARGARMFQLRFRHGYVTGVVAGARLDRFLSFGVNLDRFAQGHWYRVPAAAARELRRLAKGLTPLRYTPSVLAQSH